MLNVLITFCLMYFTTVAPHTAVQSVTDQVYLPDQSSITITLPEATPAVTPLPASTPVPSAAPDEQFENLDYIEELKKLGYIKNEYSDNDLNIRNGIVRFQADHNLLVDGDFGPRSSAALKARLKEDSFVYPDTVKEPPIDGKWILINKSRRTLTLYKGYNIQKKYPIAVGYPPDLTPDGKYEIANMIVNPYWGGGGYAKPVEGGSPYNPLGYRWMGLNIGDGGSYGVHGNSSPYSIGTEASHGCIRMINSDVEELFEIISVGTPVWITTDDGLESLGIEQKEYGIPD